MPVQPRHPPIPSTRTNPSVGCPARSLGTSLAAERPAHKRQKSSQDNPFPSVLNRPSMGILSAAVPLLNGSDAITASIEVTRGEPSEQLSKQGTHVPKVESFSPSGLSVVNPSPASSIGPPLDTPELAYPSVQSVDDTPLETPLNASGLPINFHAPSNPFAAHCLPPNGSHRDVQAQILRYQQQQLIGPAYYCGDPSSNPGGSSLYAHINSHLHYPRRSFPALSSPATNAWYPSTVAEGVSFSSTPLVDHHREAFIRGMAYDSAGCITGDEVLVKVEDGPTGASYCPRSQPLQSSSYFGVAPGTFPADQVGEEGKPAQLLPQSDPQTVHFPDPFAIQKTYTQSSPQLHATTYPTNVIDTKDEFTQYLKDTPGEFA